MDKVFDFLVIVRFEQRVHVTSKAKAIKELKETFKQEYNLDLEDSEIEILN